MTTRAVKVCGDDGVKVGSVGLQVPLVDFFERV
jgi:hypothetical protein